MSDNYEQKILNDVCQRCYELNHRITPAMIRGYWDLYSDAYCIVNNLFNRIYWVPKIAMENITLIGGKAYDAYIYRISNYLVDASSDPNQPYTYTSKENNEMYKKISDTEYENAVAAITVEYEDKKHNAKAEYDEKLAIAENEKAKANIREDSDMWAYDLYCRYDALHELGFAEELSIELLKLYISSKK